MMNALGDKNGNDMGKILIIPPDPPEPSPQYESTVGEPVAVPVTITPDSTGKISPFQPEIDIPSTIPKTTWGNIGNTPIEIDIKKRERDATVLN